MHVVCACVTALSMESRRGCWELELEVAVNCLTWVLGTKVESPQEQYVPRPDIQHSTTSK